MELNQFESGMRIKLYAEEIHDYEYGTVYSVDLKHKILFINWDEGEEAIWVSDLRSPLVIDMILLVDEKEEKLTPIERKIRNLWNDSNWVQKNPNFAY